MTVKYFIVQAQLIQICKLHKYYLISSFYGHFSRFPPKKALIYQFFKWDFPQWSLILIWIGNLDKEAFWIVMARSNSSKGSVLNLMMKLLQSWWENLIIIHMETYDDDDGENGTKNSFISLLERLLLSLSLYNFPQLSTIRIKR